MLAILPASPVQENYRFSVYKLTQIMSGFFSVLTIYSELMTAHTTEKDSPGLDYLALEAIPAVVYPGCFHIFTPLDLHIVSEAEGHVYILFCYKK